MSNKEYPIVKFCSLGHWTFLVGYSSVQLPPICIDVILSVGAVEVHDRFRRLGPAIDRIAHGESGRAT